jgi:hypothetical protein
MQQRNEKTTAEGKFTPSIYRQNRVSGLGQSSPIGTIWAGSSLLVAHSLVHVGQGLPFNTTVIINLHFLLMYSSAHSVQYRATPGPPLPWYGMGWVRRGFIVID